MIIIYKCNTDRIGIISPISRSVRVLRVDMVGEDGVALVVRVARVGEQHGGRQRGDVTGYLHVFQFGLDPGTERSVHFPVFRAQYMFVEGPDDHEDAVPALPQQRHEPFEGVPLEGCIEFHPRQALPSYGTFPGWAPVCAA